MRAYILLQNMLLRFVVIGSVLIITKIERDFWLQRSTVDTQTTDVVDHEEVTLSKIMPKKFLLTREHTYIRYKNETLN